MEEERTRGSDDDLFLGAMPEAVAIRLLGKRDARRRKKRESQSVRKIGFFRGYGFEFHPEIFAGSAFETLLVFESEVGLAIGEDARSFAGDETATDAAETVGGVGLKVRGRFQVHRFDRKASPGEIKGAAVFEVGLEKALEDHTKEVLLRRREEERKEIIGVA